MLFHKMFSRFIIILVISFTILGGFLFSLLGSYVIAEKEDGMVEAGTKISNLTSQLNGKEYNEYNDIYKLSMEIVGQNLNCEIYVADKYGNVMVRTNYKFSSQAMDKMPKDFVAKVNNDEIFRKLGKIDGYNENVFMVAVPVTIRNLTVGGVYLVTNVPELARLRKDVLKMYLFSVIAAFLISFFVIFILAKRITDPINAIKKASKSLSDGHFDTRVKVYKDDEIGQLANEFNSMADSLSKLEDMRKTFISDVSHELRTPMTTITGFIEGILDNTITEDKRDIYLKIVLDESKRLTKLVNDLLDVSRMTSDEVKLEPCKFDINELIRLTIIGFEKRFNEKSLVVNALFESDNEEVLAEKDNIKRVVTNLIDNAIKFCNEKGEIELKTWRKGDKVYISVKNDGEGIVEEDRKAIFERFYKLDKSRNRNKKGVGLGLYIVKSIINKHNQSIWVESEVGKYAKFIFTLEKSK